MTEPMLHESPQEPQEAIKVDDAISRRPSRLVCKQSQFKRTPTKRNAMSRAAYLRLRSHVEATYETDLERVKSAPWVKTGRYGSQVHSGFRRHVWEALLTFGHQPFVRDDVLHVLGYDLPPVNSASSIAKTPRLLVASILSAFGRAGCLQVLGTSVIRPYKANRGQVLYRIAPAEQWASWARDAAKRRFEKAMKNLQLKWVHSQPRALLALRRTHDLPKRDREIVEGRLRGETLAQLGNRFGLTRERVRQILLKLEPGSLAGYPRSRVMPDTKASSVSAGGASRFAPEAPVVARDSIRHVGSRNAVARPFDLNIGRAQQVIIQGEPRRADSAGPRN